VIIRFQDSRGGSGEAAEGSLLGADVDAAGLAVTEDGVVVEVGIVGDEEAGAAHFGSLEDSTRMTSFRSSCEVTSRCGD